MVMVPALLALAAGVYAATNFRVVPSKSDIGHSFLVQAAWLDGIGCPTNATYRPYDPTAPHNLGPATHYTDPACATGAPGDPHNQGLLLAKTGPTANFAAAQAQLQGVNGTTLTELGYDIRKAGVNTNDPRGSHCGAGAPRFDITMQDGTYYAVGCNSPPPTTQTAGNGWLRLRWGGSAPLLGYKNGSTLEPITGKVKSIYIVFDEGQDTGPDNFGMAVLDNVDVNGTLVGHGATGGNEIGKDKECQSNGDTNGNLSRNSNDNNKGKVRCTSDD